MNTILVTGGAGSIGSYVCEDLIACGDRVIALDNGPSLKIEHLFDSGRFSFVQDSILNKEIVERLVDKVEIVIHLAAIADPRRYVTDPLNVLNVNLKGSLYLLDRCARQKKKIVFASTSEVVGRNPKVPWNENADRILGPPSINRWCYATGKALIEHYCYAYGLQEKLPFVILRFFNVYGPQCDDLGQGRVIPIFLEKFLTGESVIIHGTGQQTRCFTFIEDAVSAVKELSFNQKALGCCFNIGSNHEISILELAKTIKKVGKFKNELVFKSYLEVFGNSYEDVPRRIPDVTRIRKIIGWEASTSLEDGLKKTIEFYSRRF